jgi:hypothetical protein
MEPAAAHKCLFGLRLWFGWVDVTLDPCYLLLVTWFGPFNVAQGTLRRSSGQVDYC